MKSLRKIFIIFLLYIFYMVYMDKFEPTLRVEWLKKLMDHCNRCLSEPNTSAGYKLLLVVGAVALSVYNEISESPKTGKPPFNGANEYRWGFPSMEEYEIVIPEIWKDMAFENVRELDIFSEIAEF